MDIGGESDILALCSREPRNALIAAECQSLTGGQPDAQGVARCQTLHTIAQAAYVRHGVQVIVRANTLADLRQQLKNRHFAADDFHISYLRLCQKHHGSTRQAIIAVADVIDGVPNLTTPQHQFLLAEDDQGFWFGEIVIETKRDYRRHAAKPQKTSTALPAKLARAIVNLVAPTAKTLINPGCGTGSILLEARALGITAFGADWAPRVVEMARENLAHFGYDAPVELIDARRWTQTGDALIADLTYGKYLELHQPIVLELLRNAAHLAPLTIYVTTANITAWLTSAGYVDIDVFRISKSLGFTRYVHRARSQTTKH